MANTSVIKSGYRGVPMVLKHRLVTLAPPSLLATEAVWPYNYIPELQ